MKQIHLKSHFSEIISLAKNAGVEYDDRTTKHISVKPNRHSLAIFTPTHSTGVNISSLLSADNVLTVYGGLIGVNTKPKGNSPSRICAVVETRQPFLWLAKFTKHIGTSTVNNTVIHHSLTVLADEYHRHSELHAQNPYAGHGDKANAIYNAMNELAKLMNERNGANVPAKPKTALQRIVERLKGGV